MLNRNIIQQIDRLSVSDRVALMEYLARSVHQELQQRPKRKKGSSYGRVVGALRDKSKPAPSDDEVHAMLADYLIEKNG